MPLFNNKFSPKRVPTRKSLLSLPSQEPLEELLCENRAIKLNLSGQNVIFDNGEWIHVPDDPERANQRLQSKLQVLEEENNMLKLKVEILLDMLTQTTAESHIQQREIDKLKNDP